MVVVAVAYTAFLYLFGAIPDLATGLAGDLHRDPRGARVRHPAHGVRGIRSKTTRASSRSCSASSSCRCSCSPARSTRSSTLPLWLQWIGWISPLWHATELGRWLTYGRPIEPAMLVVHFGYLVVLTVVGYVAGPPDLRAEAREMTAVDDSGGATRRRRARPLGGQPGRRRAARAARREVLELGGRALGLLRARLLPALDGHRPRRRSSARSRPRPVSRCRTRPSSRRRCWPSRR